MRNPPLAKTFFLLHRCLMQLVDVSWCLSVDRTVLASLCGGSSPPPACRLQRLNQNEEEGRKEGVEGGRE